MLKECCHAWGIYEWVYKILCPPVLWALDMERIWADVLRNFNDCRPPFGPLAIVASRSQAFPSWPSYPRLQGFGACWWAPTKIQITKWRPINSGGSSKDGPVACMNIVHDSKGRASSVLTPLEFLCSFGRACPEALGSPSTLHPPITFFVGIAVLNIFHLTTFSKKTIFFKISEKLFWGGWLFLMERGIGR